MKTGPEKAAYPLTLPGLLARHRDELAGRTALREKELGVWQEVSWDQYYENVKRLCLGLTALGLKRGDRLAILGDNCREWLYADLAAQSAGAIGVGVYPTNPAGQVAYVIGHSEAAMVVARDQEQTDKILEVKDRLPGLKKIVVIEMKGLRHYRESLLAPWAEVQEIGRREDEKNPGRFEELIRSTRPEDVALMVYTSGTTGPPKGARLTHRNLISVARSFRQVCPIGGEEQVVSYLPLCHIAERALSLIFALEAGYTVNFAESISTVQQSVYEIAPTVFVGVPRIWEKMHAGIQIGVKDASWFKRSNYDFWMNQARRRLERRQSGRADGLWGRLIHRLGYWCLYRAILDKLGLLRTRVALSGAAPISPEILKFFHCLGLEISQVYGQTEISGLSHYQPGRDLKIGSVGRPLPGVEFKLAPDGEILVRSDSVFAGYFKDEPGTAAVLKDGWLHTGDVGRLDEEGYLYLTDRKKDILITSGGKNIAPSEIENRLKCSPYINEAVVIGDGRPFLTALIQLEYETVGKWAQDRRIAFTTFKSLARSQEVRDLISREVEACNQEFSQVEAVKRFTLLDKELDHDDDELTATMKVRRQVVEKKFSDLIRAMYSR
ncbi:MAG: AMP-binding protein [Thermodesulfobacteriota bacterium]